MNEHYTTAKLQAALIGDLPAKDEESLERHMASCEECSAALQRLAGEPAWCARAAAMLTNDELDARANMRPEWSEADFTVDHLEPSDEPNVLGRLGGYDVLEIIGHGGMGVVLKGFDRELKRCVAIKVLAPHLARSSLARKRFAREAQAAAAVVHPHVLAIHQVQPSGRLPFLVMPLVAGESLAARLAAQGGLELKEVLRIGMQAAAGLAAAHEQGLVHRDVKPANILLEKGVERAVVADFGMARAANDASITQVGGIAGTPQYMSPEQARGEPLDGRSDLFSLGCVLYEMATGVSPFRANSILATMRRLVDDAPQAVAALNPELPPWFISIIDRLLEKDPAKRFGSAKEVSELLEECLAHVQQPATSPLPVSLVPFDFGTGSKSSRYQKGAFTMCALFGFGLLGFVLWQAVESPDEGQKAPENGAAHIEAAAGDAKGDLARLQGTWEGEARSEHERYIVLFTIEGDDFIQVYRRDSDGSEITTRGRIELNESADPKQMTMKVSSVSSSTGPRVPGRIPSEVNAIYKLGEKGLTRRSGRRERPAEFDVEDPAQIVFGRRVRRNKDRRESPIDPDTGEVGAEVELPEDGDGEGDLARLQGTWLGESRWFEVRYSVRFTIEGKNFTEVQRQASSGAETTHHGQIEINESADPKQMTLLVTSVSGGRQGRVPGRIPREVLAIYKLDDRGLTRRSGRSDRPKAFDDNDQGQIVFTRHEQREGTGSSVGNGTNESGSTTEVGGKPPDRASEPKADLEKRLVGSWTGHTDRFDERYHFRADKTFCQESIVQIGSHQEGQWEIDWNTLPPSLVLTITKSDHEEAPAGAVFAHKIVGLDEKRLRFERPEDPQFPFPKLGPITYTRMKTDASAEAKLGENPRRADLLGEWNCGDNALAHVYFTLQLNDDDTFTLQQRDTALKFEDQTHGTWELGSDRPSLILRKKRWVKDGKGVEGREGFDILVVTRGDTGWVLSHPSHGNYVRDQGPIESKAEDLYRQMVAAVAKADTLDCAFELQVKADPPSSYRGTLVVAPGNKVRAELRPLPPGKETYTIGSDGQTLHVTGVTGPAAAPPKQLAAIVRGSFGRAGVYATMFRSATQRDEKGEEVNLDDQYRASAFRLRETEKVGARAAEVVEHRMVTDVGRKENFAITVWIDAETHLPLKRVVTCEENGHTVMATEIYSQVTVNGKIDPKKFEFPDPAGAGSGVTPAEAAALRNLLLEAAKTNKPLTITPKVGVGPVKFGMSAAEVESVLGKPFRTTGRAMEYQHLGLAVVTDKEDRVAVILVGAWCEASDILLDVFQGGTEAGVRLRADRSEIVKAHGEPSSVRSIGPPEAEFEVLAYEALRAEFALRKGKLVHITMKGQKSGDKSP